MKKLKILLLAASLALNGWLAWHLLSDRPTPSPAGTPSIVPIRPEPASASSDVTEAGLDPSSAETSGITGKLASMPLEPADAMDRMYAEGYPDWLINALTASLIDLKYGIPQLQAEARVNDSKAFREQKQKAYDAAETEYNILVNWTPERLQLKYGDLDPAKIAAVAGLETRYREETDHALAEALAPVLTQPELDRYLRYNSLLARTIQRITSTIDIDEATYDRLWQHAVEREGTPAPDVSAEELMDRILDPDSIAGFREVLGDEQFLKTIGNVQSDFLDEERFYRSINLDASLRADLALETYRMVFEAHNLHGAEQSAKSREAYDAIIARAHFTPDQKTAFDQSRFGGLGQGQLSWSSQSAPTR